jgi:S1-C subfamily serine protease
LLIGAIAIAVWTTTRPGARLLTQKDIDGAVLHTLATQTLPSRAAKAYEAVRPSIVKVVGTGYPEDDEKAGGKKKAGKDAAKPSKPDGKGADGKVAPPKPSAPADDKQAGKADKPALPDDHPDIGKGMGVGTGVVIVDSGVILTNLHVVLGASKLKVVFFDGFESEATVIGMQPENDLAVLKAAKLPDDLKAAVLRSTQDLAPGDEVVAAGFPFGIGPSASAGIVSGLKREYRSPEGKRVLTNLIQFDAAANPGNSGGPLVTMDGEVVGIVTAILNPTDQRVFVGIGFAVPIENAASAIGMSPF